MKIFDLQKGGELVIGVRGESLRFVLGRGMVTSESVGLENFGHVITEIEFKFMPNSAVSAIGPVMCDSVNPTTLMILEGEVLENGDVSPDAYVLDISNILALSQNIEATVERVSQGLSLKLYGCRQTYSDFIFGRFNQK